ncbi:MAG TPA: hypothetical protein VFK40_09005 [Nitrososphaeraceae archaeon]|nr:hypothetical protein [Nitrososphaeraceae archaeon]
MSNYKTIIQLPPHTLRPSGEQMGLLFHQLAIRSAELQPGSYRSMEGNGKETKIKVPHRGEIDNIVTDQGNLYKKC